MSGSSYLWIGGIFNLLFFVFHIFFWKIFGWRDDLKNLKPINRGIMQVLNLCLMFCFLIFAYISFFRVTDMLTTCLGKSLALGIAAFWIFRAILQFIFFSRTKLVSYIFFFVFLIGGWLYLMAWLG